MQAKSPIRCTPVIQPQSSKGWPTTRTACSFAQSVHSCQALAQECTQCPQEQMPPQTKGFHAVVGTQQRHRARRLPNSSDEEIHPPQYLAFLHTPEIQAGESFRPPSIPWALASDIPVRRIHQIPCSTKFLVKHLPQPIVLPWLEARATTNWRPNFYMFLFYFVSTSIAALEAILELKPQLQTSRSVIQAFQAIDPSAIESQFQRQTPARDHLVHFQILFPWRISPNQRRSATMRRTSNR